MSRASRPIRFRGLGLALLCLLAWHLLLDGTQTLTMESASDVSKSKVTQDSTKLDMKPSTGGCLDEATWTLCSHQFKSDTSKRHACMMDPGGAFASIASSTPRTTDQSKARDLITQNNITAIAIGAMASGLCDVILNNKRTLCTDRPHLDLFTFVQWVQLFGEDERGKPARPTNLLAEHVLEHFDPIQVRLIAASIMAILPPGGVFRIAVPDGYKPSPSYQIYVRQGGNPSGHGQNHIVVWTVDNLVPIFEDMGFNIDKREFFDIKGEFHTSGEAYADDQQRGKISRSLKHDQRNKKSRQSQYQSAAGVLKPDLKPDEPWYTSLWFDVVKPTQCEETLL